MFCLLFLVFSQSSIGQMLENSEDPREREIFQIRETARILQSQKLKRQAVEKFAKNNELNPDDLMWQKVNDPGRPFTGDPLYAEPFESEMSEAKNSHGDQCKLALMLFNHHSRKCIVLSLRFFCYDLERPYGRSKVHANDAERFAKVEGYCTNRRTQAEYRMRDGASSAEYHIEEWAHLKEVEDYISKHQPEKNR